MGLIGNFIEGRREKERLRKDAEMNDRVFGDIERKKLSHNEREIIGILNNEKEQTFKEALRFEEQRRKSDEIFREREMMKSGFGDWI